MEDEKDRLDALRPDQPYCEKKLLSRKELEERSVGGAYVDAGEEQPALYDLLEVYEKAMLPLLMECEALAAKHGIPFFHLCIPIREEDSRLQMGAMMMRQGPGRDERMAALGRIMASTVPVNLHSIGAGGAMFPATPESIDAAIQGQARVKQEEESCSCGTCVARRKFFADLREKFRGEKNKE